MKYWDSYVVGEGLKDGVAGSSQRKGESQTGEPQRVLKGVEAFPR